jgi:hypothetical protein
VEHKEGTEEEEEEELNEHRAVRFENELVNSTPFIRLERNFIFSSVV